MPSTADYDTALWLEVAAEHSAHHSGDLHANENANGHADEHAQEQEQEQEDDPAARRFSYIGPDAPAGAIVDVSEMRRDLPGADAITQLVHASSDSVDNPAVATESVTSLGELMITSTAARIVESDPGDVTQSVVHRFTRVSAATSIYAEYIGDDIGLVPHIEALVAQLGRTEAVGIGWAAQTHAWSEALARAGVDPSTATSPVPPPLVFRRTDAELAASLLWSSSEGRAERELNRIGMRDDVERSGLRNDLILGVVTKPSNRRAVWIGALLLVTLVVGFALVQASNDSLVTMALVGAVLAAAGAAGLLTAELTPTAVAGTRTHVYGWKIFLALAALIGWATISASVTGAGGYGWRGAILPTVAILLVTIAILLAAFVVSYRNRASVKASEEALHAGDAQLKAFAAREAGLDASLLADLARFLASDAAAGVDRGVAVATLRELALSGAVPAWRAERILVTLTR